MELASDRRERVPAVQARFNIDTYLSEFYTAFYITDRCQFMWTWSRAHPTSTRQGMSYCICEPHIKWCGEKLQRHWVGLGMSRGCLEQWSQRNALFEPISEATPTVLPTTVLRSAAVRRVRVWHYASGVSPYQKYDGIALPSNYY